MADGATSPDIGEPTGIGESNSTPRVEDKIAEWKEPDLRLKVPGYRHGPKLSRGNAIRMGVIAGAAAVLAACGVDIGKTPNSSVSPTPFRETPTQPYTPTESPTNPATASATTEKTPSATALPGTETDGADTHIKFPDGTEATIPTDQVAGREHMGQGDVLQIWDETGTKILYAYDKENGVWVKASDILQSNFTDVEHYIKAGTWAEFTNLVRLEKMVLMPFAKDTYFPPLNKINKDYLTDDSSQHNLDGPDFNATYPLGTITDVSKNPFRYVNAIFLPKGEDRKFDTYILTEQVFNPDGTFSLLHFGYTDTLGNGRGPVIWIKGEVGDYPQRFLLPAYRTDSDELQGVNFCTINCNQLDYFRNNGYKIVIDGSHAYIPRIKTLTDEWFSTGVVPEELENLVLIRSSPYIMR